MADVSDDRDVAYVLGKPFDEASDRLRFETAKALSRQNKRMPVWISDICIEGGAEIFSKTRNIPLVRCIRVDELQEMRSLVAKHRSEMDTLVSCDRWIENLRVRQKLRSRRE